MAEVIKQLGNVALWPGKATLLYTVGGSGALIRDIEISNANNVGNSTQAWTGQPANMVQKADGTIYFCDYSLHRIRVISPDGNVTTLAGSGSGAETNGTGIAAAFQFPISICMSPDETTLYVVTRFNVRRIVIATAVVDTVAGTGADANTDGTGTAAAFTNPRGICINSAGTILYVNNYGGHNVRKITIGSGNTSVVITIAGSAGNTGTTDGTGTTARFNGPYGICISPDDLTLYVCDSNTNIVRKVVISGGTANSGVVTTFSGTGGAGHGDGVGVLAQHYAPQGIICDGTSGAGTYLYVSDYNGSGGALRRITIADATVITLHTGFDQTADTSANYGTNAVTTGNPTHLSWGYSKEQMFLSHSSLVSLQMYDIATAKLINTWLPSANTFRNGSISYNVPVEVIIYIVPSGSSKSKTYLKYCGSGGAYLPAGKNDWITPNQYYPVGTKIYAEARQHGANISMTILEN